jgi:hypothetical protein
MLRLGQIFGDLAPVELILKARGMGCEMPRGGLHMRRTHLGIIAVPALEDTKLRELRQHILHRRVEAHLALLDEDHRCRGAYAFGHGEDP